MGGVLGSGSRAIAGGNAVLLLPLPLLIYFHIHFNSSLLEGIETIAKINAKALIFTMTAGLPKPSYSG